MRPTILFNFFSPMPNKITGIGVYAFNLLAALGRRRSVRLVLLTNWDESSLPAPVRACGIETVTVRVPRTEKLRVAASWATTAWTARRIGADLVFTPEPFGAPLGGRARILVIHDLYRESQGHLYSWHQRLFWTRAVGLAASRSQRIVCVSDATQAEFARFHPGEARKAMTILEASAIEASPSPALTAHLRRPYGLMVANVAPTKNVGCLLRALAHLREEGLEPTIYWVGRDDSGEMARMMEEVGPLPNFVPLGSVDDTMLASLYAAADFYVNTSLVEGFCIPIVEAHGFGVPVLCSDIPVLKEVGGDGALLFDPLESRDLADKMRMMVQDRDLRDRLARAAVANAGRFSWDEAAAQTERAIRECLNLLQESPKPTAAEKPGP